MSFALYPIFKSVITITVVGVTAAVLTALAVLGLPKARQERGLEPLHEERFCRIWITLRRQGYARVAFYEQFVVVSILSPKVIHYDEILSASIVFILGSPYIALKLSRSPPLWSDVIQFSSEAQNKVLAILHRKCEAVIHP